MKKQNEQVPKNLELEIKLLHDKHKLNQNPYKRRHITTVTQTQQKF